MHAIYRVPIAELLDPAHRITRAPPQSAGSGPGFLIGDDKDVILWGFTAGIIARLFDFVGWTVAWDAAQVRDLPDHMLQGVRTISGLRPRTPTSEEAAVNLLDWFLVVLVLAYALSGYWQGFITGAFATDGLLLGGLFGVWLAPSALGDADPVAVGLAGRAVHRDPLAPRSARRSLQYAGARIRDRITWQPIRALDAVGGAALSAVAVLLVAWALGVAITGSRIGGITPLVRNSAVLGRGRRRDARRSADRVLRAFNNVVGTSFFPRYLEPFAPERIVEVGPAPKRLLARPRRAQRGGSQRAQDPRRQLLRPRGRGLRASSTPPTG